MNANLKEQSSDTHQEVCIDLPGETVQCWRSSDKIIVTLKKHRDIIFDINIAASNIYTIESNDSDFYNRRDKKLISSHSHDLVSFKDGEKLHLWVSRSFKGSILLKCDGKLLMRVKPDEWDGNIYDDNPKTKASPIIISIGKPSPINPQSKTLPPNISKHKASGANPISSTSSATIEDCAAICVIEGKIEGVPPYISEKLKNGGGKSGLVDIDPFDVATRNWIFGQTVGAAAYIADNWDWLRASFDTKTSTGFKLVKAQIHYVRGKIRFYFSGYSKFNTVFGKGGFGPSSNRILSIFMGMGKTESSFMALTKNVFSSFKRNALVSLIFGSITSIAEWKADIQKDEYDLAASLFMGVLKVIVASALVSLVVSIIVIIVMVFAGLAMPLIVVGALTVVAGFVLGYFVDVADKKAGKIISENESDNDGLSSIIALNMRLAGHRISKTWEILMIFFPQDYKEMKL